MKALVSLNTGSSSIKFALYAIDALGAPQLRAKGKIEKIGLSPFMRIEDPDGQEIHAESWPGGAGMTHEELLGILLTLSKQRMEGYELLGVGHRVVHGGGLFSGPALITPEVVSALAGLNELAPLHQPHNIGGITAVAALRPGLPQVACFDTAFHHTMPFLATRLALPQAWADRGVRRYGFHGLSYEYIAHRLAELDPPLAAGRVIAAHLGNGASLCALDKGHSIDSTMGFSALDGLMMGTRCGSLDAGAVLYMVRQPGQDAQSVEDILYKQSGLLGVSGRSSDVRELEGSGDPAATQALDLFAWRAAREAGGLAASLGGVDGLVFTAGIGEKGAAMRARICARLKWLGVELDEAANALHAPIISTPASAVKVRVIPTDEERMIALHTWSLLTEENADAAAG